ncbi:NAD(P)-binding domain-containing protein [Pseudomonas sp. CBSPCBW29]|nr:NAD(P)-binding domain-containing protein [Pseudomonas sp. CBSPCBW29]
MKNHYQNIIVGGGPAGINMALEFMKRDIDFLLLEASSSVGGQWDKVPVCGQLISLNKKYVPGDAHTYRMRYDWHTLSTITSEDVEKDPKLRFTNWTSQHWPSARTYKTYLQYVADSMGLRPSIRTNSRVKKISRRPEDGNFLISVEGGVDLIADRVFCGAGRSEPVIPSIKGLTKEIYTLYEDYDPEAAHEHYRNKVVVVLGRGNSAFEIAHHLVDITAETRVVTRSLPKLARQTHNVHDIRAQVSDVFDLMQLKSNNNIVSDRIVEVHRITEGKNAGRILVKYETPCVHWSPPRWMRRTGIVDEIIVCCGFNYTMGDIFDAETIQPSRDKNGKYFLLDSTWCSENEPDLYFIGAPTRVNDPDAASGFVHGFRCNIQALAPLISEKHYNVPVKPIFECVIANNEPPAALSTLAEYLVGMVSTTMPLFELYSYFSCVVTFERSESGDIIAQVWPPFPRKYNAERWGQSREYVEILFEYGFSRYGDGNLPTHYFTLPADHFDTSKSAYIHPVFHVFRDGIETEQFHMQESLIGRWDIDDYIDEETNLDQYKNVAFNACACAIDFKLRRSTLPVKDEYIDKCYPLMTDDEIDEALHIQPTLSLLSDRKQ